MPRARTRARIDRNQPELVKLLRKLGATFQHTHNISGALDGIVGYAGLDQRVEIKDPEQPPNKRKLTPDEEEAFVTWKGRKPVILETTEDCIALLEIMRRESL